VLDDSRGNAPALLRLLRSLGAKTDHFTSLERWETASRGGDVWRLLIVGSTTDLGSPAQFAETVRRDHGERFQALWWWIPRGMAERPADRQAFDACLSKPIKHRQLAAFLNDLLAAPAVSRSAAPDRTAERPVDTLALASPKVLVVDDNAVNLKVAGRFLASLGLRDVDLADSGETALRYCAAASYDIIFMDMQMPGMDGLETTREIRRRFPQDACRPWVIALTANALTQHRDACLAAGMNDFLPKPINLKRVREAIDEALAGKPKLASGERAATDPAESVLVAN